MTAEPMEGSLYLNLSHRWGISQPAKLTKASLDDMWLAVRWRSFLVCIKTLRDHSGAITSPHRMPLNALL
jgi:hypothetical protein